MTSIFKKLRLSKFKDYSSKNLCAVLQLPIFGRPLRKILYIIYKITLKIHEFSFEVYANAPYMKIADGQLKPDKLVTVAKYYDHLHNHLVRFPFQPKISILIPVYKTPINYLRECIQSVMFQTYENWEICVVDDASNVTEISELLASYQATLGSKFKLLTHAKNSHISAASNSCISLATGEYIALLDHDDRLVPNSLAEVVRYINLNNKPEILYSDERVIDSNGNKINFPFYKPDWSPWLHLSVNYTTHFSIYNIDLIRKIGGFRIGYEGAQDHDLMIRAVEATKTDVTHIPMCLYQWRAHAGSTAQNIDTKPYAAIAGEKSITEHLRKRGFQLATVNFEPDTVHYKINLGIPTPEPLVSIIIPNKESVSLLEKCVSSIFEKSTYRNFEIIVSDNGSSSKECLDYYEKLKAVHKTQIKIHIEPSSFNFGRQCNLGANQASGELLLFLNNDMEVKTPNWLEEMVPFLSDPIIGGVGCKLLYEDDTIQHAGILTAGRDIAIHPGHELHSKDNLYYQMLNTIHEVSAVTAACFMIKRDLFASLGGFDELFSPNGYGDVEFCLRLKAQGKKIIYTPYAELYHYESKSRGKNIEHFERHFMMNRYGNDLLHDPYLNPNLLRGLYFERDQLFDDLDLNAKQIEFFLSLPSTEWLPQLKKLIEEN